jgi:hypothetical protein
VATVLYALYIAIPVKFVPIPVNTFQADWQALRANPLRFNPQQPILSELE